MSEMPNASHDTFPSAGSIPAAGIAAIIRIPIPGAGNLAVELSPRNFAGKSTSSLFFQDAAGKTTLRLDYGFNKTTGRVDYHWNQKGTFGKFGIADHTVAGRGGRILYRAARVFKYAGRTLLVVGAVLDVVSIVVASNPIKRADQVVTAWALATAGAESFGALGAEGGAVFGPPGIAIGAIIMGAIGGVAGYVAGEKAVEIVWDWSAETTFQPFTEIVEPPPPHPAPYRPNIYESGGPGLPTYRRPASRH